MRPNKNKEANLSHFYLTSLCHYNKANGNFTRLKKTNTKQKIGEEMGTLDKKSGYIRLKINGYTYLAHRLAYYYVNKVWPANLIDHIDGDKTNNIFNNLRDATYAQNNTNSKPHRDSLTGIKGIWYSKARDKYIAEICSNYKRIYIGSYDTIHEAKAAYNNMATKLQKQFARY